MASTSGPATPVAALTDELKDLSLLKGSAGDKTAASASSTDSAAPSSASSSTPNVEEVGKQQEDKSEPVEKEDEETDEEEEKKEMYGPTLRDVCKRIAEGKIKNVIVLSGAGISVSAGIPDFRTPGSGLYDNLEKYDLPTPESIFDLEYFQEKPEPFCLLAKELFPGKFQPTPAHHFIKLLHDKGVLLRAYTQNIDGLEYLAGLPDDKVFQCHGGFRASHCIKCRHEHSVDYVKDAVFADKVPRCERNGCSGLVKPDITFFGEALPAAFEPLVKKDFPKCDLLIVMGTSLQVQPVAGLVDEVPDTAMRLLINREEAGVGSAALDMLRSMGMDFGDSPDSLVLANPKVKALLQMFGLTGTSGFQFFSPSNKRDVFEQGDCDVGVEKMAKLLQWSKDLEKLKATKAKM